MDGTWFGKALGIGSGEGPGDDSERDYQHIDNINEYRLKATTYTATTRLTAGDTSASTANAVNNGVSIINYCGHGDWDEFVTTSFNNSDVNNLNNGNKLPVIISVACGG